MSRPDLPGGTKPEGALPGVAEEGATVPFRSGFITIAGRPNMGKSTFLNRVLGRKAAIVTPKAQTTRTRILGVHHGPGFQIVFLDTPGIHEARRQSGLNRAMVETALNACADADRILYFVEAAPGLAPEDWPILAKLAKMKIPLVLALNKIDRLRRDALLPMLARCAAEGTEKGIDFADFIPISAESGENIEALLDTLVAGLAEGPPFFPENQWTDQPERFIAAEMVREKLFFHLQRELPYSTAVRVEAFEESDSLLRFAARILVERSSQKGIVIGRGGSMLKKIGAAARVELERFFGVKVFLELQVVVRKGWTSDPRMLESLGLKDGEGHVPS